MHDGWERSPKSRELNLWNMYGDSHRGKIMLPAPTARERAQRAEQARNAAAHMRDASSQRRIVGVLTSTAETNQSERALCRS
jgi:predicted Fe-S protein YdhL (DUF1289 family)